MKKVLIIDDNIDWINHFKTVCNKLNVESFPHDPKNLENIYTLLSLIYCSINGKKVKKMAKEDLSLVLHEFINGETDLTFIINYGLKKRDPKINGLRFYELFAQGHKTIFMSGTDDGNNIAKIQAFCSQHQKCIFINKNDENWEHLLTQVIKE